MLNALKLFTVPLVVWFPMCLPSLVQVNINNQATIRGGNLETEYKAVQFHLHWGKDGGPGSEHTIDGEQYPMEVQGYEIPLWSHQ